MTRLFSTNFCELLCGVVEEGLLDGLQVHAMKHKDVSLVFAGLQAQQLKDRADEQLRLHYRSSQHDTEEHHDAKVPDLKVADLGHLHPVVDRAVSVFSSASKACPCIAGHQTTRDDGYYALGGRQQGPRAGLNGATITFGRPSSERNSVELLIPTGK